jgi:hypothetical protein
MPLHVRPIAVGIAVIFFFGISMIGWLSGLPPYTCCKRALAGAVLAYVAGMVTVRVINAVLINAMIANQMNRKRAKEGGGRN